jgi:hypothetical protein
MALPMASQMPRIHGEVSLLPDKLVDALGERPDLFLLRAGKPRILYGFSCCAERSARLDSRSAILELLRATA